MLYTINSDQLSISVETKGAELCSIKTPDGFEYLWQASPEIWPRKAPVLFPIVGKLKNNIYNLGHNTYSLPQHGFARDMEFRLVKREKTELCFELRSDEKTKANYPFDFCLQLGYVLSKNKLSCTYSVINTGDQTMFFSIGAHPGFNIDLKHANFPYLEFEKDVLDLSLLDLGLISEKKQHLSLANKRLKIDPQLFQNDALVMENGQIKKISLCLNSEGRKIDLVCPGWTFFGIWSKPHPLKGTLDFVCLEPWLGIADEIGHKSKFEDKKGIIQLEAQAGFNSAFELSFY
jgi:galactose mutarotase-like enzyme